MDAKCGQIIAMSQALPRGKSERDMICLEDGKRLFATSGKIIHNLMYVYDKF